MNTLEVNYNSLSPEDKKLWVKAEIERQRAKRNARRNGLSAELTQALPDNEREKKAGRRVSVNDMDSITVFKNKLAAFAKAAEELDNAWDYVDGDAQVVNALIALDEESIAWPFKKQLYYLALKDAHVWANIFASKLK